MLLLAIDTSTPVVSVAIGSGRSILAEVCLGRAPGAPQRHAEQLAPAIQYLCQETGIRLSRLAGVAVGIGPGLFTGLRVGVTTAKVMAQSLGVPVVGMPSLDLVAFPLRHANRLIAAVLDARRKEVFYALYEPVPGGIQRVSEYEVGVPGALLAELIARGEDVLVAGDGAGLLGEELEHLQHVELAGAELGRPSVAALIELAYSRFEREEFVAPFALNPLYLRKSDAEIAWEFQAR